MNKNVTLLICLIISSATWASPESLDAYNIVWTSQSKNALDSMPVGGHSIGLNVWVEDGDILFYAQRSGSFTENNEYHKLGRFRITLEPNPFAPGKSFRQELNLGEGYVEIIGGGGRTQSTVQIWVEALRPVIHVDVSGGGKTRATVAYEGWRNRIEELPDEPFGPRWGCFSWDRYPGKVYRTPDVVQHEGMGVLFFHRNHDDRLLFDFAVKQQGLEAVKDRIVNTQKGRTFGGFLSGEGFIPAGTGTGQYIHTPYQSWLLQSDQARNKHSLKVYTHVEQTETQDEWRDGLDALHDENLSDEAARQQTQTWWEDFWQRSWLIINPDQKNSTAWTLGRNYQLFRYQLGCNYYGDYPTKFNGGNFTVDPGLVRSKERFSPDWRAWGGGSFTAQNQRLIYWPLLKTGDFEAMLPQFEFYHRMLSTGVARVQTYWGHGGAYFCEQTENFGLPIACAWGWREPGASGRVRPASTEPGVLPNKWIVYHYESQLEFSYMMLEYHRYTGADIADYIDFIKQSVLFFDEHYQMRHRQATGHPLDHNGKLVIYPSTACETYKMAKNPVDIIAGLQACVSSLLSLDNTYVSDAEKGDYRALLERVPAFAYDTVDGDRIIKPAESWASVDNYECPQFYPLFPFNRFEFSVDDMTVFCNTWKHGTFPKNMVQSWHQDGIFFARMGMTAEAQAYNTKKMIDCNRRFPTFWGPGHDWVPDHNHGGSGMIGLQEMLMQTLGDKIRLFPAWPKEWDVDFKLYAPQNTIVEGRLKSGRLDSFSVTPLERSFDIVNMLVVQSKEGDL